MDKGITLLEEREQMFEEKLNLEKWDVLNEMPINNKKEAEQYKMQKHNLAHQKTHIIQKIQDIEALIQNRNNLQAIRIPIDTNFAKIAQGAIISGAVLPSGMRMYTSVGQLNWIVEGSDAVLRKIEIVD